MKIKKIEIENFGKFHNFSLELNQGISVIYGNNEDGKTTLMTFIKMMFYSEQKRSRDISNNPRKKYMPWNGMLMGGAIEFESKGIEYRIEKEMGATPVKDKVKVINLHTGETLLQRKEEIGKFFFGTDLAGFERSIFIGQMGAFGADKEDEIAQKLSNMYSSGDERISQNQVLERIGKAKEELKTIRGNKGFLVEAKEELEKLKETKAQIKELEEAQEELLEEYKHKMEELLEKKNQKKRLENWKKVNELKSIQQRLRVLIEKVEEENHLMNIIDDGKIPVNQIDSFLAECLNLQREMRSQEVSVKRFLESSHLQVDYPKEIKEEEYRKYETILEKLGKEEQCLEYFQKNLIPAINSFKQSKEQGIEQKFEERISRIKKIFLIGNIGSIFLILLGMIVHPIGYIAGIISGIINFYNYQNKKKHLDSITINDDPVIQKMQKTLNHQIEYFRELFNQEYRINMDEKQYLMNIQQKKEETEGKLKLILKTKNCKTTEEFKDLYLESLSNQKNQKTLNTMEKEYREYCNKLLKKVSQYEEVDSIEAAEEKLEILNKLFIEYKEKQNEIRHIAKVMDYKEVNLESLVKENVKILEQIKSQSVDWAEDLEFFCEQEEKTSQLEEEIGDLEETLPGLREKIRTPEKNLSQLEVGQKQLEEKIEELQAYYDSLVMAETVIREAGEEIRQSFGPELNQKTSEIFQQLTGGKYKQVLVTKDYDLLAQPTDDIHYRESSYLSNGTIDQAYLALRLAITQLITGENESFPLFLDDIFLQYDDKRANKGFAFLVKHMENEQIESQIIMLTCHEHIIKLAKEQGKDKVNIIRL